MRKFLFILIIFIFTGCYSKKEAKLGIYGDDTPLNRQECAKMISLYSDSYDNIKNLEIDLPFSDCFGSYDKYINYVYKNKIMFGYDDKNFKPKDSLTLEQGQRIIDNINKTNEIEIIMRDSTKNDPISIALFNELFLKSTNMETENLIILADKSINKNLENRVITDKGIFICEDIDLSPYINHTIEAITKENIILMPTNIIKKGGIIKDCFVLDKSSFIFNGLIYNTDTPLEKNTLIDVELSDFSIINTRKSPLSENEIKNFLYKKITQREKEGYKDEGLKVFCLIYLTNVLDDIKKIENLDITPSEKAIKIVDSMYPKVLKSSDTLAKINYYSVSCGLGSNIKDVWNENFEEKPYPNLLIENNEITDFDLFFKNKDIASYDDNSPYFRWEFTLNYKDLEKIRNNIKSLEIMKLNENGEYVSVKEDIGKIKDIIIAQRGKSGNVNKIEIHSEKGIYLINGDNLIKNAFNFPILLTLNDKSVINYNGLPSSFFTFTKISSKDNYLKEIHFYGGGLGHGVGFSLNSIKTLEEKGFNYNKIVELFYNYVKIEDSKVLVEENKDVNN